MFRLYVCMWTTCESYALGGQKSADILLLEFRMLINHLTTVWVLKITLKCRDILPASGIFFYQANCIHSILGWDKWGEVWRTQAGRGTASGLLIGPLSFLWKNSGDEKDYSGAKKKINFFHFSCTWIRKLGGPQGHIKCPTKSPTTQFRNSLL